MTKIRGHITYYLSPFEQRVFKGFWMKSLEGARRKIFGSWIYGPIPGGLAFLYLVYWSEKRYEKLEREHWS
jgi:hypothetical protein